MGAVSGHCSSRLPYLVINAVNYSKDIKTLPESLGLNTQLRELDLSNNKLTALPASVGQLTNLHTLNLGGNKLTAFPHSSVN